MFEQAVAEAREYYHALGYDTLPLEPNSKKTNMENWQNLSPRELWERAPVGANIGIRCGGPRQNIVLDADDKNAAGTSGKIVRFLDGLGIHEGDYPVVATPSDSRHFHLALVGEFEGSFRHLAPEVGAGEFRYGKGAQVAAPPSVVNGREYRLIAGNFANLPQIALADVLKLLPPDKGRIEPGDLIQSVPPIEHPWISRRAQDLLAGEKMDCYQKRDGTLDRSKAEQALITSLINTGQSFDSILELFESNPCAGKFKEMYAQDVRGAIEWLERSFRVAKPWAITHESEGRTIARNARKWALSRPWMGQGGATHRVIFLAHTKIAYRSAKIVYGASLRELAEKGGVSYKTAWNSTNRLIAEGLIVLIEEGTFNLSALYRIGTSYTLSHRENVRECVTDSSGHDLFRIQGFGSAGAQIWDCIVDHPESLIDPEIALFTGRNIKTVEKKLNLFHQNGMVLPGEIRDGFITWEPQREIDLDQIAKNVGVYGIGEQQRKTHIAQRAFRRRLFGHAGLEPEKTEGQN